VHVIAFLLNNIRCSLTLSLSQRERGITPFSLWEKGGDEGAAYKKVSIVTN
jgi:hypothetical protein